MKKQLHRVYMEVIVRKTFEVQAYTTEQAVLDVYLEERRKMIRPNRKDFRAVRQWKGMVNPIPGLGGRKPRSKTLAKIGEYLLKEWRLDERCNPVFVKDLVEFSGRSKASVSIALTNYAMLFEREPSANKADKHKRGGMIWLSELGYEYFTREANHGQN